MSVIVQNKDSLTPAERAAANAECQAIIDETVYRDSPLRAYIIPMDRFKNTKDARGQWTSELTVKPYMETAGRVAEAHSQMERRFVGLQTYLNPDEAPIEAEYRGQTYITAGGTARAVVVLEIGETLAHFTATEAIRSAEKGVNATHSLANAETSAIGRALGFAGFGNMPGSSLSPAETMAATAQDDEVQKEPPKAPPKTKKAAPLTGEALEGVLPFVTSLHEAGSIDDLLAVGRTIAANEGLAEDQIAYLQAAYRVRKAEIAELDAIAETAAPAAAEVVEEAADAA